MNRKIFAITTVVLMMFAGIGIFAVNSDESEAADSNVSVTVAQGQSWTYTVSVNLDNPSYSLSGSATSWCTLTDNVVSGTVPSTSSTDTSLVITASTTQPTQSYTQTITFTIIEAVGLTLGDSVNGTIDQSTGEMIVSGFGEMYDWTSGSDSPVYAYASYVKSVVINYGPTTIGDHFMDNSDAVYDNFTSLDVGFVTSVGDYAFYNCIELTGNPLFYAEDLVSVGSYAFAATDLTFVWLGDTVTTVGDYAFMGYYNSTDGFVGWDVLAIGSGLTTLGDDPFGIFVGGIVNGAVFYEYDGTSITYNAANIKNSIYVSVYNSNGYIDAYNCLYGTALNTTYSNSYTYMVAGATVPNEQQTAREDDILLTATYSVNSGATVPSMLITILKNMCVDGDASGTWTLGTAIGSATLGEYYGSSNDTPFYGGFVSGTAPTTTGTVSSSAIYTVYYEESDNAPTTFIFDYGLNFNALIAPELQFISTP